MKKQKGKVIRLSEKFLTFLEKNIRKRETYEHCIKRLMRLKESEDGKLYQEEYWTLPSYLFSKKSEAKGRAIVEAAAQDLSVECVEKPIKVVEGTQSSFKQRPRKRGVAKKEVE